MVTLQIETSRVLRRLVQSILSLSFNLGGLLAGFILAINIDVFSTIPWAIILLPGILTVKGAIGGILSGRLSTSLHLGTIKPSYGENTRDFYLLLSSITVLAFLSCLMMGSVSFLIGLVIWRATLRGYLDILCIAVGSMGLSLLIVSPITIAISFLSFKRGLDPDIMVYPITSTVADIIVTFTYIKLLWGFFSGGLGLHLTVLIDLTFLSVVLASLYKNFKDEEFTRTLKEFTLTLLSVTVITSVTGLFLSGIREAVGSRPEVYLVYPALIDTVGDTGSIIGSTATTKLFTGMIESSLSSIKEHTTEILNAWAASIVMFILYSMTAATVCNVLNSVNPLRLLAQITATNLLSVSVMVFIVFSIAISTFKRALNPDNFVIPIESSLADAVTTISLYIAVVTIR
ncbi:hypothetical protein DRO55_00865 [Candidatus Bathyarchaeota archaeon]|nr:MAG: hypothetical protein DRO55_00865 [Candidatus Bathyarchaeota archaeon]